MRKVVLLVLAITLLMAAVSTAATSEVQQYTDPTEETNAIMSSDFVVDANGFLTAYTGSGGDIVIPDGVIRICPGAFANCTTIKSVVVPISTMYIDSGAFNNCTGLTKITISSCVDSFYGSFTGCVSLKELNIYDGTGTTKLGSSYLFTEFKERIETLNIQEGFTEIEPWTFDSFTGLKNIALPNTMKIIGQNAFSNCINLDNLTIPENVTTINGYAFDNCTGLKSITIPYTVNNIGYNAFKNCSSLVIYGYTYSYAETYAVENNISFTSIGEAPPKDSDFVVVNGVLTKYAGTRSNVSIPSNLGITGIGVCAFQYYANLTNITIPESVTSIEECALRGCTSLTALTLPDSIAIVGRSAFSDCTSLSSVSVSSNTRYYDFSVFDNCPNLKTVNLRLGERTIMPAQIDPFKSCMETINIADGFTGIGNEAFSFCRNLKTIQLPDSITRIGDRSFIWCENLAQITIPNSVFEIGTNAFQECKSLKTVEIPDSVTTIGESAFSDCTNLSRVIIPDSVTEFGYYVFSGCVNLTEATIQNGTPGVTRDTFYGCPTLKILNILHSDKTSILSGCYAPAETINIGEGITSIEDHVFQGNTSLQKISLPNSLQSIGREAFDYCSNLTGIIFPANMKTIGDYAFEDCNSLMSITIPNSIESIGAYAFELHPSQKIRELNISLGTGTTEISNQFYAFANTVRKINIAEGITSIPQYTFGSYYNTSITIPQSVVTIGEYAFESWGSTTLNVIYNSAAHRYAVQHNIPFVVTGGARGGNLQIDSSQTSHVTITVKDAQSKNIIADASVDLNGLNNTTNDSGMADFENVANGEIPVSVTANGYGSFQTSLVVANPHVSEIIYLENSTNTPRATSLTVSANGTTRELLRESYFSVDKGNPTIYTLTTYVDWQGQDPGTVKLTGGTKSIAFTENKLAAALGNEFPEGEDFKLEIYNSTGELMNSSKVYMSIIDGQMVLDVQADLSKIQYPKLESLPIDIAFFDSAKFNIDLKELFGELFTGNDIEATVKDGKIKIRLGNKTGSAPSKEFYKGKWGAPGKKMKMRMIGEESIDVEVFGELEIPIAALHNDGIWEGAIGFEIMGSASELSRNGKKLYSIAELQHQLAVGFIPVVVKAKISAGLEAVMAASGPTDFSTVTLSGSVTPECAIRGSAGVGAVKVANICLYGEGKGDIKVNLFPTNNIEPKITLDFGLELEVGWFKYDQSLITAVWPKEAARYQMAMKEGEFVPIGRDYLNHMESKWLGDRVINRMMLETSEVTNKNKTTLLTNAFPNAYAAIEDTLLLFSQDDLTRTPVNAPKLVFAIKNGSLWTTPVAIDDDSTADGYFSLSKGNSVFAAWENIKEVLPAETGMNEAYGKSEIKVGKFTGTAWDITTLTDNSVADFQPQITAYGDQAVCAWLSNTANDIFCNSGSTNLNYAVYDGFSWGTVETIFNVGYIAGYAVAFNGRDICFALDKDVDGDNTTIEDREIFIQQAGGSEIRVTDNSILDQGCEIAYHQGKFKLVWLTEAGIKIIDDVSNLGDITTITDNYIGGYGVKIAQNGDKMNLFWQEENDGFVNLYGATYIDGKWSKKVDIITGTFDVQNFDAFLEDDGSFSVSYLEKEKTMENENGEIDRGSADLCVLKVEPSYNIAVSNPYYDDDQYYMKSQTTFSCDVTVTGEEAIQGLRIFLMDGENILAEKSFSDIILPGETKEFSLPWLPDASGNVKNLALKVLPDYVEDFDLRDNTVSFQVGYADAAVETTYFAQKEEGYQLNSYIANIGSIPLDHATFKLKDKNNNVVYSEEINHIDVDKLYLVQYLIPFGEPSFINGVSKYYAEVETEQVEIALYNNSEMAVMTEKDHDIRDLNSDGAVDVQDLAILAKDWGLTNKDTSFNNSHDLNSDGVIDIYDLVIIAKGMGA